MITTINEFKNSINENNSRITTMAIEELLKWYTGDGYYFK